MVLAQMDIGGNPYLGVFCAANEKIALVPIDLDAKLQQKIVTALNLEVVPMLLASSRLIGSLMVLNSSGAVVHNFAETNEILKLKKYLNVTVINDKLNALGNNILCNDRAALVHPEFGPKSVKDIEDALGVEVVKGTVAGLRTVGTAAVITNNGGLCHPKVKEDELKYLRDLFKVEVITGTANYGTPFIGACLIANSKGVVTGTTTTGIEMGRIEEGFQLI